MDERQRLYAMTGCIIAAAMRVHSEPGPGLLESAYEACLAFELAEAGFKVERQKPLPLIYRGVTLDCGYRLDLLVNDEVIVEIKAVESVVAIHRAQLISYLKLSGCKVGLLMNFNVPSLRSGIHRFVHGL